MSERSEKAKALFHEGYNCCQAVAGAFADLLGCDPDMLARLCDGFGGGMGRMRLTCGAVSGMTILAGLKLSSGKPSDRDNRTLVYGTVRDMAEEFRAKNGSVICGELLGTARPKDESPRPEVRTEAYYKKRPCAECVADCVEIAEKYLFSEEIQSK